MSERPLSIAQKEAVNSLSSISVSNTSSSTEISSFATSVTSITSTLASWLLIGHEVQQQQSLEVETDTVSIAVAIADSNKTSSEYLSKIAVANGTNSISVSSSFSSSNGSNSAPLLISVTSISGALFSDSTSISSNATSVDSAYLPDAKVISDVISIQVTNSLNPNNVILPSFMASVAVSNFGDFVPPVLRHNCTIGVMEHQYLLCPESFVLINLTCSGLAAAIVHRRCPVPQRVCNLLSLTDLTVANDNY